MYLGPQILCVQEAFCSAFGVETTKFRRVKAYESFFGVPHFFGGAPSTYSLRGMQPEFRVVLCIKKWKKIQSTDRLG